MDILEGASQFLTTSATDVLSKSREEMDANCLIIVGV